MDSLDDLSAISTNSGLAAVNTPGLLKGTRFGRQNRHQKPELHRGGMPHAAAIVFAAFRVAGIIATFPQVADMSDAVLVTISAGIATISLNRANVHNAFDDVLIADLTAALGDCQSNPSLRAVVLTGIGSSFSAGADLNWMRGMAQASEEGNRADSLRLANLMRTLNFLSKPTIARVNGSAYGGGIGLVACCDVAIGVDNAKFSLSEVKLGLVPAVISPYVIAAIGARQARRLFISGEVFDATVAARMGLLHETVAPDQLDVAVERALHFLAKGGPQAQAEAKQLALRMAGMTLESAEQRDIENASLIARLRVSAEGQHGLAAFLDKRAPDWARTE